MIFFGSFAGWNPAILLNLYFVIKDIPLDSFDYIEAFDYHWVQAMKLYPQVFEEEILQMFHKLTILKNSRNILEKHPW